MGNLPAARTGTKTIELRVSHPSMEMPTWKDGRPREILARVGLVEDRNCKQDAAWEEPVLLRIPNAKSVICISLFAVDVTSDTEASAAESSTSLLTEVCLPYGGRGGLADMGVSPGSAMLKLKLALTTGAFYNGETPDKLATELKSLRERYHHDGPHIILQVRELLDQNPSEAEVIAMSPARRQVISLELQNAMLRVRRRELGPSVNWITDEDEGTLPSHIRQLHAIQQENTQLATEMNEVQDQLERMMEVTRSGPESNPPSQERDMARMLTSLEKELEHGLERRRKIAANYEDRANQLREQLSEVHSQVSQATLTPQDSSRDSALQEVQAMEQRITKAIARRDDLQQRWQEVCKESIGKRSVSPPANPDVQRLQEASEEQKVELERLQQEIKIQQELEQGSEQRRQLQNEIQQLCEQLEELQKVREDERMRSKEEARELRSERAVAQDKLFVSMAQLQNLRMEAHAAKMKVQDSPTQPEDIKAEIRARGNELEQMRMQEEDYKRTIQGLRREEELLKVTTSRVMAQAAPVVGDPKDVAHLQDDDDAAELRSLLLNAELACNQRRDEVAHLWSSLMEAQEHCEACRRNYEGLHRRAAPDVACRPPRSMTHKGSECVAS